MIYLLDTNVISDRMKKWPSVVVRFDFAVREGHTLALCPAVYYELVRGLIKNESTRQIAELNTFIRAIKNYPILQEDWLQAAQFWAFAKKRGREISDMDLLLAAMTHRLNATLVTSDADFDVLPITHENWR